MDSGFQIERINPPIFYLLNFRAAERGLGLGPCSIVLERYVVDPRSPV